MSRYLILSSSSFFPFLRVFASEAWFFSLIYLSLLLTTGIPRACSTTLVWFYALGAWSCRLLLGGRHSLSGADVPEQYGVVMGWVRPVRTRAASAWCRGGWKCSWVKGSSLVVNEPVERVKAVEKEG